MSVPAQAHVRKLDNVFAEMSAATDHHVWEGIPELTMREKVLLCIVAHVCQQTLGLPFELHVIKGLEHGVSADDLRELLRWIAHDSGYPAALAALARLTDIEREHGLPGPSGQGHEVIVDASQSAIPAPARKAVYGLDVHFGAYMDLQSCIRVGVKMTARERAFTAMISDVFNQTLEESFRAHVTRAFGAGATAEEVRAVVRFSAQFGMTKAWRGLRALNALLTETGTIFV